MVESYSRVLFLFNLWESDGGGGGVLLMVIRRPRSDRGGNTNRMRAKGSLVQTQLCSLFLSYATNNIPFKLY